MVYAQHLKKAGGHIGRNKKDKDNSPKILNDKKDPDYKRVLSANRWSDAIYLFGHFLKFLDDFYPGFMQDRKTFVLIMVTTRF